jgi:cytochrome c-type biogenesis protein
LLLTALYVTWYGWYEIRVIRGGDAEDPVVGVALSVQQAGVRLVDGVGATRFAVVAALLAATAVAVLLVGRRRAGTADRRRTGSQCPRS